MPGRRGNRPVSNPIKWEVDNETYHGGPGISNSALQIFHRSSEEFYHKYVARDQVIEPQTQTAALTMGSGLHCYCLEPHKLNADFWVRPEGIDGRTKEGKAQLADLRAANIGKLELKAEEMQEIRNLAAGIMRNPAARELMEAPRDNEFAVRWTDDATGLDLKCKFDLLPNVPGKGPDFADIKTIASYGVTDWQWAVKKRGYHRAHRHYSEGFKEFFGFPPLGQYIVIVKGSWECTVYAMDDDTQMVADYEWRRDLDALAECYRRHANGDPMAFMPEGYGGIVYSGLPNAAWELKKIEERATEDGRMKELQREQGRLLGAGGDDENEEGESQ